MWGHISRWHWNRNIAMVLFCHNLYLIPFKLFNSISASLYLAFGGFLVESNQYAMYVWTNGFDRGMPGCGEAKLRTWDTSSYCFTHTWDTAFKRQWLWDTVNNPGREVSTIFVSDMKTALKAAYVNGNCDGLENIKALMEEGHTLVIWIAFCNTHKIIWKYIRY